MSEELILIYGDRNQLAQVIINLVMNASAAMKNRDTDLADLQDKPTEKPISEFPTQAAESLKKTSRRSLPLPPKSR
jgi:hypothetical protein